MEQNRPGRIDDWNPAPEYIAENEPKQVNKLFKKINYCYSKGIFKRNFTFFLLSDSFYPNIIDQKK